MVFLSKKKNDIQLFKLDKSPIIMVFPVFIQFFGSYTGYVAQRFLVSLDWADACFMIQLVEFMIQLVESVNPV
jgi:hypothetical protein